MKRLIMFLTSLLLLTSCGTAGYTSRRTVYEMDEVSYILANHYPQLHYYYMEGVLDVTSLKEIVLEDGTIDYKVKYRFVRYYYTNYADRMETLKVHYPELYQMYVSGVIEINSLYKYVEKETGKIRHHVSYRRIYDYYYDYYPYIGHGGVHLYYRPRPVPRHYIRPNNPPSPPRARPDVRPNNPPRPQPNTKHNNPPRQQPNTRPNNPPRSNNNGGRRR